MSRVPDEKPKLGTQENNAAEIQSNLFNETPPIEDTWGVLSTDEISRLKSVIGKNKRQEFEKEKLFTVASVDKSSPDWKRLPEDRSVQASYTNIHDAFNTLKDLAIKPRQLMDDFAVEKDSHASADFDYSHLSHIKARNRECR